MKETYYCQRDKMFMEFLRYLRLEYYVDDSSLLMVAN